MSPGDARACAAFSDRLTAYLDGELAADRVSALRGHLRECEACRTAAAELAVLRDGLRALPPLNPPTSLWAGVQAQLAAQEVADAHRAGWRRWLARFMPVMPRFGGLAIASAAAAGLLLWHAGHRGAATAPETANAGARMPTAPATPTAPAHPAVAVCPPPAVAADLATATDDDSVDVAVALAAEPARTAARYDRAAAELLGLACDARAAWTDAHRAAFDTDVNQLRAAIASAAVGKSRDHASRALIRYLQHTVTSDDLVAISGAQHDALAAPAGAP